MVVLIRGRPYSWSWSFDVRGRGPVMLAVVLCLSRTFHMFTTSVSFPISYGSQTTERQDNVRRNDFRYITSPGLAICY